jgi:hypothetical protein
MIKNIFRINNKAGADVFVDLNESFFYASYLIEGA